MRSRWLCQLATVLAAVWLGLTAVLVPAARAEDVRSRGAAAEEPAVETPATGAVRLVRIGPQVLVEVDENGRVTPVDEDPPRESRGAALGIALLFTLGIAAGPLVVPSLSGTGATSPTPIR